MTNLKTTFKEQLKRAKENEINIVALDIAYETQICLDFLTDEEFELCCGLIYRAYMQADTELPIYKIIYALEHLIENENGNVLQALNSTTHQFLLDMVYEYYFG